MPGRTPTAAFAVLALIGAGLVASAPAHAGGGHAGYGGHVSYSHGYGHGYGHAGYGHRFGGRHGGGHYRRHHGGHTAANVLLGVTAGLLFLDVVEHAGRRDREVYATTPRRVYRVAEPPRYAPPPQPTAAAANSHSASVGSRRPAHAQ